MKVLVTGSGPGGHGEQILKSLQLAPERRYEVMSADANPVPSREQGDTVTHRLPLADHPDYLDELVSLCRRTGARVVFHGSEPELKAMSRGRAILEDEGIFVAVNSASLIELCLDKSALAQELDDIGFPGPRSYSIAECLESGWTGEFPLIVKPRSDGGGSRNVFLVQDDKELCAVVDLLGPESSDSSFVVQEYCGLETDEFTVGVLHDREGRFLGSAVMNRDLTAKLSLKLRVKNRTQKLSAGEYLTVSSGISQGFFGAFPEIAEQCRTIAEVLGSRGPLNFQLRFIEGRVRIFEINPRFSGTTSARAYAGLNEPDLFLQSCIFGLRPNNPVQANSGFLVRTLREEFRKI